MTKDLKRLLRSLKRAGFSWTLRKSGHVCIHTPEGYVFTGSTPSDSRSMRNLKSRLLKSGIPAEALSASFQQRANLEPIIGKWDWRGTGGQLDSTVDDFHPGKWVDHLDLSQCRREGAFERLEVLFRAPKLVA